MPHRRGDRPWLKVSATAGGEAAKGVTADVEVFEMGNAWLAPVVKRANILLLRFHSRVLDHPARLVHRLVAVLKMRDLAGACIV